MPDRGERNLDAHVLIQQHPKHSDSIMGISPPGKIASKTLALTLSPHTTSHHGAGIMTQWPRNPRPLLPQPPHLPPIEDLKAIGVWCWQPHQYHHSLIGQKAPGIPIMADVAGRPEATWRSIYPSLKMRTPRMLSLIRVGDGTWLYTVTRTGCWDHTLLPYAIQSLQGYPGELVRSSLGWT